MVSSSRFNCAMDEPNRVGIIRRMIRRTCGWFQPQRGSVSRFNPRKAGSRNSSCRIPASSTAQPSARMGTCRRGASHSAPAIMQILRMTGARAGSAKRWKLLRTPPASAVSDTNSRYGNVSRSRSVVSASFSGSSSAPGAKVNASCGAKINPIAVMTSSTPPSVPATRAVSSRNSAGLRVSLTWVNTGTKAVENDPSANRRRMKFGMRNAMTKASVAALAPKTWLIAMSRARPSTREIMVIALNENTPRSRLGAFTRKTRPH